jgi:hypothetical protein
LNIGSPEEPLDSSTYRRYAFFRKAYISYTKDNIIISAGIISTRLWDYQQKFWGKRYVANSYLSKNGYAMDADVGISIDYKINDIFKVDFTLTNGEGYYEVQLDNSLKSSASLIITPDSKFAVRLYGDIIRARGIWQNTLIGFAGFKNEIITIGAEISHKTNLDMISGHHVWGISGTGSIGISKKKELFARFDYATSVTLPDDILHWNRLMDGNFAVIGLQHTFNENVKMALNYQGTYPYNSATRNSDVIFINASLKF